MILPSTKRVSWITALTEIFTLYHDLGVSNLSSYFHEVGQPLLAFHRASFSTYPDLKPYPSCLENCNDGLTAVFSNYLPFSFMPVVLHLYE